MCGQTSQPSAPGSIISRITKTYLRLPMASIAASPSYHNGTFETYNSGESAGGFGGLEGSQKMVLQARSPAETCKDAADLVSATKVAGVSLL